MELTQLPVELISAVFDQLSQNELARVSRTCKSFHEIVEPILYSSFTMPLDSWFFLLQHDKTSIPLLIRTLLDHPHRSRCFKTLEFVKETKIVERGTAERLEILPDDRPLPLSYQEQVKAKLDQYTGLDVNPQAFESSFPGSITAAKISSWHLQIFEAPPNHQALSAFLMLLLPNLEAFTTSQVPNHRRTLLAVLQTASKFQRVAGESEQNHPLGAFPRLRRVGIYSTRMFIHQILDILNLPLAEFSCDFIREHTLRAHYQASSPSLQRLSLLRYGLPLSSFRPLFAQFTRLRALSITYFPPRYDRNIPVHAILVAVVDSITHLQNTLEQLDVKECRFIALQPPVPFPSLRSFTLLHTLRLDWTHLHDLVAAFALLPPNLRDLTIWRADHRLVLKSLHSNLEGLLALGRLPRIDVRVYPRVPDAEKQRWEEEMREVVRQYESRGVVLLFGFPGPWVNRLAV